MTRKGLDGARMTEPTGLSRGTSEQEKGETDQKSQGHSGILEGKELLWVGINNDNNNKNKHLTRGVLA